MHHIDSFITTLHGSYMFRRTRVINRELLYLLNYIKTRENLWYPVLLVDKILKHK
jgi:hypothetical protein